MLIGLVVLLVLVIGEAGALYALASRFSRIEDDWRRRERELIDRLLRQSKIEPLEFKHEQVVTLADPVIPPPDPISEAFKMDAILEEMEQKKPEIRGLTPDQAQELYPVDWAATARRYDERHKALAI